MICMCTEGEWAEWSAWTDCSTTCGYGLRQRSRWCNVEGTCNQGGDGPGEMEYCYNEQECPGGVQSEGTKNILSTCSMIASSVVN